MQVQTGISRETLRNWLVDQTFYKSVTVKGQSIYPNKGCDFLLMQLIARNERSFLYI